MSRAAHTYAAHGYRVFPCAPRGKRPLTEHGVNDATTNDEQITAWWTQTPDANIGIATGRDSNLIVIDIDGTDAADHYGRLILQHGPAGPPHATDGASVQTGRGWHLWFAHPPRVDLRNSASRLAPGIDIRANGGYVIAPPSIHPTGGRYQWVDPIPETGLPRLNPEWVRALITPPTPPARTARAPKRRPPDADQDRYSAKALADECAAVANAPEGQRNHRLNEAAFNLGQLIAAGRLPETAISDLAAAAETAGLTPRETDRTIASGLTAGRKHPRR